MPRPGGKRRGAGRPQNPGRRSVPHRRRVPHVARCPAHVTLRRSRICRRFAMTARSSRSSARSIRRRRAGFRVFEFSVQTDHMHLLVEADDPTKFERGMRGLTIRIAKAVNRATRPRRAGLGRPLPCASHPDAARDAERARLRAEQLAETPARSAWIGCEIVGRLVFGMEDAGGRPRQVSGSPRADVARDGGMATSWAPPRRRRSAEKKANRTEIP